jgi:hypothetical protein
MMPYFSASVFGEQRRLQPMADDQKSRWKKEVDWLLSVADHIVEFVPSQQVAENGTSVEVRNHPISVLAAAVRFKYSASLSNSFIQTYMYSFAR